MRDGDAIVFVEVRSRAHDRFMDPAQSVDARKRARLILAGQHYLQREKLLDTVACRFDVIAVIGGDAGKIEWLKGAFEA